MITGEQVWHYLQYLPEETQWPAFWHALWKRFDIVVAKVHQFTVVDGGKSVEQLPHWVRKEGHMAFVRWCDTLCLYTPH